MVCPTCGRTSPATARHCRGCGEPFSPTLTTESGRSSSYVTPSSPGGGGLSVALPLGTVLNGQYRVKRVIGTGAFGRVYLAEDMSDPSSSPLAIKELLAVEFATADEQRDAITWFKREVGTLLALDHPGIPAIHGYWTAHRTAGPMYLAMDFIPGKTLLEVQAALGGVVPWQHAVGWGIGLCDVLTYLHSRMPPYIFRDIKPANVLLDSRSGSPVLIDFGLARQLVPVGLTAVGTWGYVAYEQVLGKAEARSDLYGLGAMLHALVTGRQPDVEYRRLLRDGLDVEGALRALFPSIETILPSLPSALAHVLSKATAFIVEDRFPDATSMAEALQAVLTSPNVTMPVLLDLAPAIPPSPAIQSAQPSQQPLAAASGSTAPAPLAQPTQVLPPRPSTAAEDDGLGSQAAPPPPSVSQTSQSAAPPVPSTHLEPAPPTQLLHPALPADYDSLPAMQSDYEESPGSSSAASAQAPMTLADLPPLQSIEPSQHELPGRRARWSSRQTAPAPTTVPLAPLHLTVSARGGAQFTSIREAIRKATPGSRIEVWPGVYTEGLVIDKPLEIIGVGPLEEIVVEAKDSSCVLMHADAAIVRGMTLRYWTGIGETRYYAVNVPEGRLILEDCHVISNSLASVAIHGPKAAPQIRRCIVRNFGERGIMIYEQAGGLVEDCDISGNTVALRISLHSAPQIRRCRIHDGKLGGVSFSDHAGGLLDDCDIVHNGHHGVAIIRGSNPSIRRCRITNNSWSAISVSDTSGALVQNCDLTGNKRKAFDIGESARLKVRGSGNKEV